jgi:hypothetical protein
MEKGKGERKGEEINTWNLSKYTGDDAAGGPEAVGAALSDSLEFGLLKKSNSKSNVR